MKLAASLASTPPTVVQQQPGGIFASSPAAGASLRSRNPVGLPHTLDHAHRKLQDAGTSLHPAYSEPGRRARSSGRREVRSLTPAPNRCTPVSHVSSSLRMRRFASSVSGAQAAGSQDLITASTTDGERTSLATRAGTSASGGRGKRPSKPLAPRKCVSPRVLRIFEAPTDPPPSGSS